MCERPDEPLASAPPVEFHPYLDAPPEAVDTGKRIVRAARLDVGGIENLETDDAARLFDINANSNLRPSVATAWGFDPFERVVDFLVQQLVAVCDRVSQRRAREPGETIATYGSDSRSASDVINFQIWRASSSLRRNLRTHVRSASLTRGPSKESAKLARHA